MKITFLWHYYPLYLVDFYRRHEFVKDLPFEEHRRVLLADHFGWPGDLSTYMAQQGVHTDFLVWNDACLQRKWAREHGCFKANDAMPLQSIAIKQIQCAQPDVLWMTYHRESHVAFVREAGPSVGKIALWMGSPFETDMDVSGISILFTENPGTLARCQERFKRVVVTKPGFDRRILAALPREPRRNIAVFVGQISQMHTRRAELLSHLIERGVDLEIHGFSHDDVARSWKEGIRSTLWDLRHGHWRAGVRALRQYVNPAPYERHVRRIAAVMHPPVFGMEMYRTLGAAQLAINAHIDLANQNAGNMRVFEATGSGCCLVTDQAANLDELFVCGEEVLTYGDKEELEAVVRTALTDPARTSAIAERGQQRTLTNHCIERMCDEVLNAFSS